MNRLLSRYLAVGYALVLVLTAAPGPAIGETPEDTYSFANHLKRDGMFEAAAQQFLKFARENPGDPRSPEALFVAAECLIDAQDSPMAATVLETLVDSYPDHPEQCRFQLHLGRLYYKLERFEVADRAFTRIIVSMPDCPDVPNAMLGKGESLISMHDWIGAREVLETVVEKHLDSPAAPRASFNLAFCLSRLERRDEALVAYENIVARFPGDPLSGFAALEAARMYTARGEDEQAVSLYERAKQFNAKVFFVPASQEGGELLDRLGKHAQAQRWFEELLMREDLDDPRTVHVRVVASAFLAGNYTDVKRLSEEYDARYPKTFSPQIALTNARAAIALGEHDRALEEADKLESFSPGTQWGLGAGRIRAEAYEAMGRSKDAVREFNHFVSVSTDSTARCEVLRHVAQLCFVATGDTLGGLDALRRLLDVERREVPSELLSVAAINESVGHFGEAKQLYEEVVSRFPLTNEAEDAQYKIDFLNEFTVTDYASAARTMDRASTSIARSKGDGLLQLAQARIDIMKDFAGALAICNELEKTSQQTASYPQILYMKGLCSAKLARVAAYRKNDQAARNQMNEALTVWKGLLASHANTPWAARAAFERPLLRYHVQGEFDVADAEAVLTARAKDPEGAELAEALADHFAERGDEASLPRAAAYYDRAISLGVDTDALRLKRAMITARRGDHKAAVKEFERIAENEDGRVGLKASFEAGRSLRELKRYRDAVVYFERAARADLRGAFGHDAGLQAADCYYLQQDYERALMAYDAVGARSRDEGRRWHVHYRIGLTFESLGRYQEALARFRRCISQSHGGAVRVRAFVHAADIAQRLGDEDARLSILEEQVGEFGISGDALPAAKELVRIYLRAGRALDALEVAELLVSDAKQDDHEPRALYAMALYRTGETVRAKSEAAAVARAAGNDSAIYREIGVEAARFHYEQHDYKIAVESIRPFAENCSGPGVCEEARYIYATSLLGAADLQKGNAIAQSFFRDYPLSDYGPLLHLRMANVLSASGRASESLLHYEEAAALATDSSTVELAIKNLAITLQKLERWNDAERAWTRLLTVFPDLSDAGDAAMGLARCKWERGDFNGSIATYEQTMPILDGEQKARAYYWMGMSYERLGDLQSAVVEYLKVPYMSEGGGMWIVTAQLKAAECYAQLDRSDAAREIYNKVLRNHGADSTWGKHAQKGIDQLDAASSSREGGGQR